MYILSQTQQHLYVPGGPDVDKGSSSEPEAVITAVRRGDAGQAVHFVRNVFAFMPDANVVLHDLGLSYYEVSNWSSVTPILNSFLVT